ncbi:MAG TPA: DUF899 family protein [Thermomonospora sp.]|nr:DUF899 family protein [Thermomonospora sp.]
MADVTEPRRLWPAGADPAYVEARRALLAAEKDLLDHAERVAAARRELPPGPVLPAYVFTEGPRDLAADGPVTTTSLRELFDGHGTLVMYHLMFAPDADEACPMCSMWVDGFHGVAHHIARHAAFAVAAKAPLDRLRAWGRRRGWNGLRLVSAHDSAFNADLGVESEQGAQRPGVSVFDLDGDRVRHRYTMQASVDAELPERGIDLLSPVWQVLDLLPGGRGSWYAANDYAGAARG